MVPDFGAQAVDFRCYSHVLLTVLAVMKQQIYTALTAHPTSKISELPFWRENPKTFEPLQRKIYSDPMAFGHVAIQLPAVLGETFLEQIFVLYAGNISSTRPAGH